VCFTISLTEKKPLLTVFDSGQSETQNMPTEIALVGGTAILANYDFREMTYDIYGKSKVVKGDVDMYKTIITLKSDISSDHLEAVHSLCESAFNNRAGKLSNASNNPYTLIFEGDDKYYGCLDLGTLALRREKEFIDGIQLWQWIEDDPNECCDLLEVFARHAV
jgi:hypothetical protein